MCEKADNNNKSQIEVEDMKTMNQPIRLAKQQQTTITHTSLPCSFMNSTSLSLKFVMEMPLGLNWNWRLIGWNGERERESGWYPSKSYNMFEHKNQSNKKNRARVVALQSTYWTPAHGVQTKIPKSMTTYGVDFIVQSMQTLFSPTRESLRRAS